MHVDDRSWQYYHASPQFVPIREKPRLHPLIVRQDIHVLIQHAQPVGVTVLSSVKGIVGPSEERCVSLCRLVSKEEGLVPQDGRDSPHILMAKVLCHFLAALDA